MELKSSPEEPSLNVETAERQEKRNSKPANSNLMEMKDKYLKPTLTTSILVIFLLNIAMVIVGITTLRDCPAQRIIPIYLIAGGGLGIITKLLSIVNYNRRISYLDWLMGAFILIEIIWFILGSYWIYSIYIPNYSVQDGLHCDKTAYLLAFWLVTIHYILLLLAVTISCFMFCFYCLFVVEVFMYVV